MKAMKWIREMQIAEPNGSFLNASLHPLPRVQRIAKCFTSISCLETMLLNRMLPCP